ncbi:MAG TPA: hypothetical protein VG937_15425 [Polyangiaceae bacterium]|nr:hypothetical protein [Polyangiaceae bacterium]
MTDSHQLTARIEKTTPRLRSLLPLFALSAVAFAAPAARANGRFPYAQQLREPQTGDIVVAGTYGLLLSANAGKDFQFVCESSLFGKTLMGSWLDPLLETLPDGSLISGSRAGLRVSRDRGCTFQNDWSLPFDPTFIPPAAGASGGPGSLIDLCPAYDGATAILALATIEAADHSTVEHRVYRTGDGAKTWAQLGTAIQTSLLRVVLTIDAAPSKPSRIYVSGTSPQGYKLVVSDDGGATWTEHPIPFDDSTGVDGVYIGAVSPTDPDRVYLRVNRESETDEGSTTWDDSLLVTDDGGKTFREVLRRQASLLGFAVSADGNTVAAGYGDPAVAPIIVADADLGLYGASASDLNFTQRIGEFAVSCLRFAPGGLYACAKELDATGVDTSGVPDFHVGVFKGSGLPQKLADFTPLLKLKDVRGPMPWLNNQPSGCAPEWTTGDPANPGMASACQSFNACMKGGVTPLSAGAIQCGATANGGTGGSATSGGAGAVSGGTAGTAGAANTGGGAVVSGGAAGQKATGGASGGTNPPADKDSGCGCRVPSRQSHDTAFWGAFAGALLGLAATRRKFSRSTTRQ